MQASRASMIAAAAAASLLLVTIALIGTRSAAQPLPVALGMRRSGVPLSLTPPSAHRTAVKAQKLAAGFVKQNKEGYNTYRQMCVEGCRREGKDWPEEECNADRLTAGWLQYSKGCEEGPEEKKKCKLSKVYCNGRYHATFAHSLSTDIF